nr:unnamed protein product [Digitaria exilis]
MASRRPPDSGSSPSLPPLASPLLQRLARADLAPPPDSRRPSLPPLPQWIPPPHSRRRRCCCTLRPAQALARPTLLLSRPLLLRPSSSPWGRGSLRRRRSRDCSTSRPLSLFRRRGWSSP